MTQPLHESDILFPYQSNTPSFSTTLSTLRRSTLSLHNRLSSITSDSFFVTSVASAYNLPLIANERCGSWYIPTTQKAGSVYFKSTDGHMGQWKFSLRRLNLQLLDVVAEKGGAIVVDSTRRGKSMPDALSKTVPIWCAVVNRAVFGEAVEEGRLYVPPSVVGESERVQMEGRIAGFLKQFREVCKPHIPTLRAKLTKPLRPIWITQASSLPPAPPSFLDFYPIVLCTASRRVQGAEISENGYVQGAADDHEAWAHGLTPPLFWANKDLLLNTSEEDAPSVIEKLVADEQGPIATATLIRPTKNLYISACEGINPSDFDAIIECTPTPLLTQASKEKAQTQTPRHHLHLACQTGKLGSRTLRTQLPKLPAFLASLASLLQPKILVCCPTGKDLSVGVALAILCLAADDQGVMDGRLQAQGITKDLIKQKLSWITTSNPALNPSRATLQAVNAVLFARQTLNPTPLVHSPEPATHDPTCPPRQLSIPERIFTVLHTPSQPWTFTRTLSSVLPTHPSGRVTGTATFTPCAPGAQGAPALLYAEQGEFTLANGMKFGVQRRYVYLLEEGNGRGDEKSETEPEKEEKGNPQEQTTPTAPTSPFPPPNAPSQKFITIHFYNDDAANTNTNTNTNSAINKSHTPPHNPAPVQNPQIGDVFVEMDTLRLSGRPASSSSTSSASPPDHWLARNKAQHLCAEDLYTASWKFSAGMVGCGHGHDGGGDGDGGSNAGTGSGVWDEGHVWWEVRYDAKGPKKDYSSVTRYVRM
ncbi:hypothetical protein LEMA_P019270.1 [Plenodomus lingam JN3]|uniref:Initiator tRNA phosphoribosyl transferase n=1 Tax=Leptosphaeria maculans (strain JN3 / isolate v23.1.3 / race Av1-4-5-6-7-8) TaxID=985895 RepID=E5AAV6_LEPMJ|nr:hypothetical protein LEMA_P019270.1 [Plenodomus lingam JN3]CBY00797.1 hypothetical protein LEMA_P019270.1 [Plenodomus lingam JN3]